MTYLKPNRLVTGPLNALSLAARGRGGIQKLVVTKRVSGGEQTIPVIPVEVDGTVYVVSARGETQWVRNVRAAGRLTLEDRSGRTAYAASEIPVEQRAEVLAAYRKVAKSSVKALFTKLPDDADHPVFALTRPDA